jgi:phage regulator Rha-like protein
MFAVSNSSTVTMSSREIAELTKQRHDNVKAKVKALADSGVIHLPEIQEYEIGYNNQKGMEYVFSGDQGKRDSTVVVAQLDPTLTGQIVDRWIQLEGLVARTQPTQDPFAIITDPMTKLLMNQILETAKTKAIVQEQGVEIKRLIEVVNEQNDSMRFLSVKAYASANGYTPTRAEFSKLGKDASFYCRANSIEIRKVDDDGQYGRVGTYPLHVLQKVFHDWQING